MQAESYGGGEREGELITGLQIKVRRGQTGGCFRIFRSQ